MHRVVAVPTATLRAGDHVRIRGERWTVTGQSISGEVAVLHVRGGDTGNAGADAHFLLPFEPIERIDPPRRPRRVSPAEWRLVARRVLGAATPRIDSLRAAAQGRFDLLPFQLEPALATTTGLGCRVLIADEVGLGKTVQAGLIVAEALARVPDGHVLIVCPAGLRAQWQHELLTRFATPVRILDAAGLARSGAGIDPLANPWSVEPAVVTSIDFVKRPEVMRALEGLVWDVLVLDEAHNLATKSDRAAAANALALRARQVVMLSATPHSGDADAFARLCATGDRHGRFPLLLFRRTRADAGLPVERRTHWLRVSPTPAESDLHAALAAYAQQAWQEASGARGAGRLAISVLLRRAASSAASLEQSVERRLALLRGQTVGEVPQLVLPFAAADTDDDAPAMVLGCAALRDSDEEQAWLERLQRLARIAGRHESKVAVIRRFFRRAREPALIFTAYRDTLVRLRQLLSQDLPVPIVELHGGLTRTERLDAERAFTSGAAAVLLATDAASEGLNLHHRCRCVINLEVPWNPVRLEQRIGRVDRIGQQRRVHAVHLVAAGTLEAEATRRLRQRAARAERDLAGTSPTELDVADAVLTGVELPELPAVAAPAVLRRPELAARAAVEAVMLATSRKLAAPRVIVPSCPVVTRMRRGHPPGIIWAVEIPVEDQCGALVWSTIAGLFVAGTDEGGSSADVLPRIDPGPFAEAARAALEPAIRIATDRELAIDAAVRQRHARIAADLLQPGLFDHRAERRAAMQAAVLEEALARCRARLDLLARLERLAPAAPIPRFVVVFGS